MKFTLTEPSLADVHEYIISIADGDLSEAQNRNLMGCMQFDSRNNDSGKRNIIV